MVTCALYLRVSLDATGDRLAVDRQREDCLKIVKDRGWTLAGEYVDNSISASDARKRRPEYDRLCEDYDAGGFDALVCWDLDRLTRQPRQLEDWIDRAAKHGLKLVTANGGADLTTDGGRMYARIKAAVARAEVERKGARQSRAQRQRAEHGKPPKGVRLTGYTLAGEVIQEEAEVIKRIFDLFSAGDTLKGIARGLEDDGIKTRRGGTWSSSSVSTILRNARYAGRSVYKGQNVGAAGWPGIVSEAQFDAVQARLTDPRRTVNRADTARKHIGSGVYYCGTCDARVRSSSGLGGGKHRYTCRENHFYRSGAPVDHYVLAVIRGRLAQPDLSALVVKEADKDKMADLNRQRNELDDRLAAIESDYDEGLIDGRRYAAAVERVQAQLVVVQREQSALVGAEATASVLGADDPVAAFDRAPLAIRQRIIDVLATITLYPGTHGSRTFDPETVKIVWNS